MNAVEKARGFTDLSPTERADLERNVDRLRQVTTNGISIRYAEIDEKWCCLNLGSLADLVQELRALALRVDD